MMPARIIRVPAAGSQLSVKLVVATGSPAGLKTSRPGQAKIFVHGSLASYSFTAVMLVIEKIAMITRYGA